jgi:hypothetical protein
MKPTLLTPAILMTAALLGTTAAHAQSDATAKAYPPGPSAQAWPPGPTAQAYPPGPTGQAAAQTNNVNVVNIPTVAVGNVVTIKESPRQPLFVEALVPIYVGQMQSTADIVAAPAGTRMVIETVNVRCYSTIDQAVGIDVHHTNVVNPVLTMIPVSMVSGGGMIAGQSFPVHLEVDDALTVNSFRTNGLGNSQCAVAFSGYTIPLP